MTRRELLALIPSGLTAAQPRQGGRRPPLPPARGEFIRYADPLTENPVVRLTMPTYESLLPEPGNRFVSSREGFLVCSTTRGGKMAPFHVNLRSGILSQLAEAMELAHRSLALDWSERNLYFVDSGQLRAIELRRRKARTVTEGISDFHMAGPHDVTAVLRDKNLQLISGSQSTTLATGVTSRGLVSPLGTGCVFCRQTGPEQHGLWYAAFSEKSRLMAQGLISCPRWRPDGQAVLFLRQVPRERYVASELREVFLDGSPEHVISETGQFASFSPNGDGSVFVGASRSKAQPSILLMLRTPRREMVLCEHRSSNPAAVSPAFSPNSQRVYFQSEREGNYCLYSVNVEPLVEKTGEDSG